MNDRWNEPGPIRITLARACGDVRQARGMTKQRLAQLVGVSATYVASIESGRANPTIDVVERIARALDLECRLMLRAQ